MTESNREAYDRGTAAGMVTAKLAEHDEHLLRINGSMARVADELHTLAMAVQGLRDDNRADAAKVKATAEALEKADAARRDKAESAWSPVAKRLVVVGSIVGVLAVLVGAAAVLVAVLRG